MPRRPFRSIPRSPLSQGTALIDAICAIPEEEFADMVPPIAAKTSRVANLSIPLSRTPAAKKIARRAKAGPGHRQGPGPAKPLKARRR
jgi:hypothetical protein